MILSLLDANSFDNAVKNGNATGNITLFYYNINKDNPVSDAYATALGGDLKYTTDSSKELFATISFHNSTPISKEKNKKSTSLFNNDNNAEALNVVGESFLGYKTKNSVIKAGNFLLNTPLLNKSSARIIPYSYQGVSYLVNNIFKSSIQLNYIDKIRAHTTDEYKDEAIDGNIKDGITMFGFKHHPINPLDVHIFYYYVPTLYDSSFAQIDYKDNFINNNLLFCVGLQHYKTFNDKKHYKDVDLIGFRTGFFTDNLDITLNYTKNRGTSTAKGYGGLSKIYTRSMISNGRGADKPKTWMLKADLDLEVIKKQSTEFSLWLADIRSESKEYRSYYAHIQHRPNSSMKIFLRYEFLDYKQNSLDVEYLRFITSYDF